MRIAGELRDGLGDPQGIVASGRVTQDLPSRLQVLADVLGAPVEPVTMKRATLHGTALHALDVLDVLDVLAVTRAPVETAQTPHPVPAHRDHYWACAGQYEGLYRAVIAQDPPGLTLLAPRQPPGGTTADRGDVNSGSLSSGETPAVCPSPSGLVPGRRPELVGTGGEPPRDSSPGAAERAGGAAHPVLTTVRAQHGGAEV